MRRDQAETATTSRLPPPASDGDGTRHMPILMNSIPRADIERVARIYKTNQDASQALGIHPKSFSRLCRQYGVETPYLRQQRRRQER